MLTMDKDKILVSFGNNLRAERNRRNLSQEGLANISGISNAGHVGQIENGVFNIKLTTLVGLLKALDVKFEDLFDVNKL